MVLQNVTKGEWWLLVENLFLDTGLWEEVPPRKDVLLGSGEHEVAADVLQQVVSQLLGNLPLAVSQNIANALFVVRVDHSLEDVYLLVLVHDPAASETILSNCVEWGFGCPY